MVIGRIRTSTTTLRSLRWLVLLVATIALGAPASASARSCSAPEYPGSGYFTSLKVTGTGCATGRKVTLAHYRCRVRSGVKGRCSRSVLRYRCTEKRTSIPTQINARVTCRRGRASVVYTYQQNT